MILLKSLQLNNFLSHESSRIDFKDNQKLLIDGNSGSGKSSILEAIIWGLYGEGRSGNSGLIKTGAEKAEVVLTLTTPDGEVVITRSITAKGKHTLDIVINGVAHAFTGVRELQNWIETDLTGASYVLFVNSIAYLQGGADSFVTQSATQRKELLLEIVKSVDFDAYYEKIKTLITKEEKEFSNNEEGIRIRTEWVDSANLKIAEKPGIEKELATLRIDEDMLTSKRESALVELGKGDEKRKALERAEGELRKASLSLETIKKQKTDIDQQISICKAVAELEHSPKEDIEAKLLIEEAALNAINGQITELVTINERKVAMFQSKPVDKGFLDKIQDVKDILAEPNKINQCSNTDCPYFHDTKEKVKKYEETLLVYMASQATYESDLFKWQKEYDAMPTVSLDDLKTLQGNKQADVSRLREEIATIEKIESAKVKLAQYEADLVTKTSEKHDKMADIIVLEQEIEEAKASVDTVKLKELSLEVTMADHNLAQVRAKIEVLVQALGVINTYIAQLPETQQLLQDLQKLRQVTTDNLYRLGLLKEAFGSKGIKTIVIDYIIPELEEKINEILSQMSDFRVMLDTQQLKADGKGDKEGLFITIVNDMGEEMSYENYSGGEKLKIIVAITEALATLQKCGFRIYDETFSALDENSLESFVQVLNTLLERFSQVICISHLQEIKSSFDDKITVTKHNGSSHVE